MTDKQAKIAGIELAWKMVLKDARFPTLHGSYDVLSEVNIMLEEIYLLRAEEEIVKCLTEEILRQKRRDTLLKIAMWAAIAATGALLPWLW